MKDQQKDARCRQLHESLLPNIADYVSRYAKERLGETAIIEHNTGESLAWRQFNTAVSAFAAKLLAIGLTKGDVVATSLPLLKEHVFLIYACYRVGIIVAPLDLRLKAGEIPLNRVAKTDYLSLREQGRQIVAELRARGGWDRA